MAQWHPRGPPLEQACDLFAGYHDAESHTPTARDATPPQRRGQGYHSSSTPTPSEHESYGPTTGDPPGSRQPTSGQAPCGHAACAGLPHCAAYLGHAVPPWFPPKQPAAVNLTLPADAPEDAAATAKCLESTLELWEDWHAVRARRLPPDLAASELRKLATRTAGAVGAAAQSAVTRQQMGELLHFASGVMREARQERGAEFLELLADNLAAAGAGRGAALVSNIVTGGRQSMTGGTQQLSSTAAMRASLRARADAEARAKAEAGALARALSWLQSRAGGWLGVAAGLGLGLAAYELLLRRGAGHLGAGLRSGVGSLGGAGGEGSRRREALERRRREAFERRRHQCEAANARAREFIKEQRDNRVNFFWHRDPPPDTCAMPPEGLPWRPAFEEWD